MKYQEIFDYIRRKIDSGEIKKGDKLPTENELSEKFNVSRITSKRAVAELMNLGVVERIRGKGSFYIGEKDQQVTEMSQRIIAIVFYMNDRYCLDYIRGTTSSLNSKGYILTPYFIEDIKKDEEVALVKKLKENRVSGVIYYPETEINSFEFILACKENGLPIVTIDKEIVSFKVDSIVSDNFSGGYKVAQALIDRGYKKIAQIYSNSPTLKTSVLERFKGVRKAIKDNNLTFDTDNIYYEFIKRDKSQELRIRKRIKKNIEKKCDAIICENDIIASDVAELIDKKIEITGFDALDMIRSKNQISLTVKQNFYKIGELAGERIVKRILNPDLEIESKRIDVTLIDKKLKEDEEIK